jgi:hypothetical protein
MAFLKDVGHSLSGAGKSIGHAYEKSGIKKGVGHAYKDSKKGVGDVLKFSGGQIDRLTGDVDKFATTFSNPFVYIGIGAVVLLVVLNK